MFWLSWSGFGLFILKRVRHKDFRHINVGIKRRWTFFAIKSFLLRYNMYSGKESGEQHEPLLVQAVPCMLFSTRSVSYKFLSQLLESEQVLRVSSHKHLETIFAPSHFFWSQPWFGGSAYELKWEINIITSSLMKKWWVNAFSMLQFDISYLEYVVCFNYIKRQECDISNRQLRLLIKYYCSVFYWNTIVLESDSVFSISLKVIFYLEEKYY